jgi:hypothetical protein
MAEGEPGAGSGELGVALVGLDVAGSGVAPGGPGAGLAEARFWPGLELGAPDIELRRRRFAAAKSDERGSGESGEDREACGSGGSARDSRSDGRRAGSPMLNSGTALIGVQSVMVSRQTRVEESTRPARHAASMSAWRISTVCSPPTLTNQTNPSAVR